ncbi:MAG TPA: hypothetical protein VGF16_16785 [Bryobacteraceae bacterium]|jgi:hypothetical protein
MPAEAAEPKSLPTLLAELEAAVEQRNEALLALLQKIGDPRECKCGVRIYFVRHKNGRVTPYNMDGSNHSITCKNTEEFRRKGK